MFKVRKLCDKVINGFISSSKKLPGVVTRLLVSLRTCGSNMGGGFSTHSGWEMGGRDMDTVATPFGFREMKEIQFY